MSDETAHVLKVAAWNSTVLGRRANPTRSALDYSDGWLDLGVHDKRSYVDGCAAKLTGKQKINFFGAGRKAGFSCGEYLHAPVLGPKGDDRRYRVRCRFQPGMKYRGRTIKAVRLERKNKLWHWILELEKI